MNFKKELIETYLDWVNNYFTIEGYASANSICPKVAKRLILKGRVLYYKELNKQA